MIWDSLVSWFFSPLYSFGLSFFFRDCDFHCAGAVRPVLAPPMWIGLGNLLFVFLAQEVRCPGISFFFSICPPFLNVFFVFFDVPPLAPFVLLL